MVDLASNVAEYTVSEISNRLKKTVEEAYGYVRVRGEISGFKGRHSNGHSYFALKDEGAKLDAVVFRLTFGRLRFKPEEGLEVIATGRLTTFPGKSAYQMIVDALEPAGVGALMALLEERRKRLAAEGLFDEKRKKALPYLPRHIGVVTSPTGAVVRDILHRLRDRFPVPVTVWPVRVQGETAAEEVANAIRGFNNFPEDGRLRRPDVLIVARGGGSLEDLWAFNEEAVVRAAAASRIPLISAIGHETDWTLLDHVADRRAPTPTGAAEMSVPVRSELIASVGGYGARHRGAVARFFETRRREFRSAVRALPRPEDFLLVKRRRLDEASRALAGGLGKNVLAHRVVFGKAAARLSIGQLARGLARAQERLAAVSGRKLRALEVHAERKRSQLGAAARRLRIEPIAERLALQRRRLEESAAQGERAFFRWLDGCYVTLGNLAKVLDTLSYRSVLARGFALVKDKDGAPIRQAEGMSIGTTLAIEFHDGKVGAVATTGNVPLTRPTIAPPRRRRVTTPNADQGSLF
ncbi:MAG: exodeoxyribonuclease VII large subunit [Bauldia sp.]|nr:exodeoxyribonuclease VII large subunit [Bauldia sp.]